MIARLMEMFAAGPSSAGSVCRNRVNLQRRFTILADMSSQGSMSRVYKALDQETGRTVCLKVQNRERMPPPRRGRHVRKADRKRGRSPLRWSIRTSCAPLSMGRRPAASITW